MLKLEELKPNIYVRGLVGDEVIQIVATVPVGTESMTVICKNNKGHIHEQLLGRSHEASISLVEVASRPWSFAAEGTYFKLALEAQRIRLAHLFDPMMAVHTSNVDPLPHQITAVYESMLPRQPLRFVLADDPGAGKTIMAGLLIKELIMRGDAKRVLIVTPGSLSQQWQDELLEKFGLPFQIFSKEKQEQSVTGNYFEEANHLICRLDQLSRNEELVAKLSATEWDLIIVDEAHKMGATYFGGDLKETDRFKLGKKLSSLARHFLLMTATPHNGKEEDFQLFMSLLDGDRFYGKFREGAHKVDVTDMMRRMVKEELLKFDGTKLFPERKAYTAAYDLSDAEAALYAKVTDYVREEMNRADRIEDNGKRKGTVGFALASLQRRLASSPAAIYESLKRRHKKLELKLEELKLVRRGQLNSEILAKYDQTISEDLDEAADELNAEEYENLTQDVVDQATAAQTIEELSAEIIILKDLEEDARRVVHSGEDRKWTELSKLLQDTPEMKDASGRLRKLIIFTESRDTLNYLHDRIVQMLGNQESVVTIHGGTNRDLRRQIQVQFRSHPNVLILIATDAAGEGVNLQNANLMVNYDLPWNPNRIEQRFGRIHRIGQTEVCHLWNMLAKGTREGEVFQRLLEKLEVQSRALGGRVFNVLGEAFDGISLKKLLIEAIRYGESAEVRARQRQVIEGVLDTKNLLEIMRRNALVEQHMSLEHLYKVKDDMDKAEARKLQPYFIRSFFKAALESLGGDMKPRENGRWEIRNVPPTIRERDRVIGETRTPVAKAYERICFEKQDIRVDGKPMADLIHPGHPMMASVTDIILENHRKILREGTILIDPSDDGIEPRVIFMLDHGIRESSGNQRTVSQRLQFVSIDQTLKPINAGWAPHIDLRPISAAERELVSDVVSTSWVKQDLEAKAQEFASQHLAQAHFAEIKERRETQSDRILAAVHERLTREIDYWSDRYIKLKEEVSAGKQPRMQPENAKRRVDELTARLEQRKREIAVMRNVISATPNVIGGALVIPAGLLAQKSGETTFSVDAAARKRIELAAMQAVVEVERSFGHAVIDVSAEKCGWDITARPAARGDKLPADRHIEVKGKAKGQSTVTITANEIMYALNQQDKFILAIVIVDGETTEGPFYIKNPFENGPGFGEESRNFNLSQFLGRAVKPETTLEKR
ncbi:MAG: helicase-related protein [Pseudomonadota bacterium]|nr:helicase-related protein [Pseudomonadota bacterium]